MSAQKPIVVRRVSQRMFEARIPVPAYDDEPLPPNRGSFRATRSSEWVHLLVSPTVARGIERQHPKFCDARLLAQASIVASARGSYLWDIDLAIADGSGANRIAVQAWRDQHATPPFSSPWPGGRQDLEMAIANARPIVARMRRHGLQVESRASDEPPGPPTIRESIPQGRVTGQGSAKQTIRFATWNLNHPSSARLSRQIEFLQQLKCDIVALQEISANGGRELSQSGAFRWCWLSLPLRARAAHESTSRDQGCAILATDAFRPASEPDLLWNAAAPERTLVMELEHSGISLSVASLRQVAGADRKKWGPMKKRQQFDAISSWLEGRSERGIVGIDANSPEVDHPDVSRNGYFFGSRPGDQHEHLLHDPSRAPHQFRDALRVYLGAHPQEFDRILTESPDGPLAVSHRNLGRPRRFDFIYITPDVGPETVSYLSGETMGSLSDHALVVADLAIGDQA